MGETEGRGVGELEAGVYSMFEGIEDQRVLCIGTRESKNVPHTILTRATQSSLVIDTNPNFSLTPIFTCTVLDANPCGY